MVRNKIEWRYELVDEDESISTYENEAEALEWIEDWNEQMETDYKSIKEFNDGEEYYRLMRC